MSLSLVIGGLLEWRNAEGYQTMIEQVYALFEGKVDTYNAIVEENCKLILRLKGTVENTIVDIVAEDLRKWPKNGEESRVTVNFTEGGSGRKVSVSEVFKGDDHSALEQFSEFVESERIRMS